MDGRGGMLQRGQGRPGAHHGAVELHVMLAVFIFEGDHELLHVASTPKPHPRSPETVPRVLHDRWSDHKGQGGQFFFSAHQGSSAHKCNCAEAGQQGVSRQWHRERAGQRQHGASSVVHHSLDSG